MFGLSGPLLDACVLSILERGDAYGYSLTQQVRQVMDVSESSLYPVLRRLEREGHLSTYNQAYQGRKRRYYSKFPISELKEFLFARNSSPFNLDSLFFLSNSKTSSTKINL